MNDQGARSVKRQRQKKVTSHARISDVAKLAGVSTATVSRVINQMYSVRPETTACVQKAIEALNYHSNSMARALRQSSSHTIGIIIPHVDNPFYSNIVNSVEMAINKEGYSLILYHSCNDLGRELMQIGQLKSWQADGIILAPSSPTYDYRSVIDDGSCPIIFFDRQPNIADYHGVFCNMHNAIQGVVEEMIVSGHQRIACLLGPQIFPIAQERKQGYIDALAKHGIVPDERMICSRDATVENGYALMEYAINALHATAVMVANRKLTIGALQYMAEHDIKYPKDVAIVGYSANEWSKMCSPALSTVMEPIEEMGTAIGGMLLDLINNPGSKPKRVVLESYVNKRSSY